LNKPLPPKFFSPTVAALECLVILCDNYDCIVASKFALLYWFDDLVPDADIMHCGILLNVAYMFKKKDAFDSIARRIVLETALAGAEVAVTCQGENQLPPKVLSRFQRHISHSES
jgi:hypothetical protein